MLILMSMLLAGLIQAQTATKDLNVSAGPVDDLIMPTPPTATTPTPVTDTAATDTETDTIIPVSPTLPAYMHIECDFRFEDQYPGNESLISTLAGMMDWCGCENKLNPDGLAYAGMSVYDDHLRAGKPIQEQPSRTWVCSANTNAACDSEQDWYLALANVSAQCNNGTNIPYGHFYDAQRQMAWGFGTYWNSKYCEEVAWVGIA